MNSKYDNSFIYEQLLKGISLKHYRTFIFVAIIQLAVEIIYYFMLGPRHLLFLSPQKYLILYIALPTAINIVSLTITWLMLKSADSKKASWIITIESLIVLSGIYFFHNLFEVLCLTFFILTTLTLVYGERSLTIFTGIAAIFSKVGIDLVLRYTPLMHRKYGFHLVNLYQSGSERSDLNIFNNILYIISILFTVFIGITMISLEGKKQLIHDMSKDSLTGLYNRKSVMEYLERLLERKVSGIVILMDLDGFKQVNDKLGHPFGDKVLKDTAEVIMTNFRSEDVVARLGGDEFMVVAKTLSLQNAIEKCDNLINNIENTYTSDDGEQVKIEASIGVAEFPADGDSLDSLYQTVDKALYKAKELGKGQIISSHHNL